MNKIFDLRSNQPDFLLLVLYLAEDCEAISQGTHICIGVTTANGDVKLRSQNNREGAFYTFCIQANFLTLWFVALIQLKEGTVCSEISVEMILLICLADV